MHKKKPVLTPTTYGLKIQPPFSRAKLVEDGPGDELLNIFKLKLIPILKKGERNISYEGAAARSKDWGQRAAFALQKAGEEGKISKKVWRVGQYVVCGKTVWRLPRGVYRGVWCVVRNPDGFYCRFRDFDGYVDDRSRCIASCKLQEVQDSIDRLNQQYPSFSPQSI